MFYIETQLSQGDAVKPIKSFLQNVHVGIMAYVHNVNFILKCFIRWVFGNQKCFLGLIEADVSTRTGKIVFKPFYYRISCSSVRIHGQDAVIHCNFNVLIAP